MSFKVGDIVQLKSGGPKMTVTDPDAYGDKIDTTWFAGAKKETGRFPPEAIDLVQDDKK